MIYKPTQSQPIEEQHFFWVINSWYLSHYLTFNSQLWVTAHINGLSSKCADHYFTPCSCSYACLNDKKANNGSPADLDCELWDISSPSSSSCEEDTIKQLHVGSLNNELFGKHFPHPFTTVSRRQGRGRSVSTHTPGSYCRRREAKIESCQQKKKFWKRSFVVRMMPKNLLSWTNVIRRRLGRQGL